MRGVFRHERQRADSPRGSAFDRLLFVALVSAIAGFACVATVPAPTIRRAPAQLAFDFSDPARASVDPRVEVPSADFDEVDATASFDDSVTPAELALFDWPPDPDRVTRVEVDLKQKHRFFGMRRFDVRTTPADERFAMAWVYEHLRQEGILAPRVRRVRLRSNESDWGIVTAEERIAKEMLESQQRREGVTFGFDVERLPTAVLDIDGAKKVRSTPKLDAERETLEGLLQAYLRGDLPLRDVFDVDLLARFLGVAEFWGAGALVQPGHLHFYFNPITQRAEPIGWMGGDGFAPDLDATTLFERPWPVQLLRDPELRAAVSREGRRIADSLGGDPGPAWLTADAGGAGSPPAAGIFGAIDAWVERSERLASTGSDSAGPDLGAGKTDRGGSNRDAGGEVWKLLPVPGRTAAERNPIPEVGLEEALQRHPFLEWDAQRSVLRVMPGVWAVADSLVVPPGIGLEMTAGTTLRFAPDAFVLASGPLRFAGSETQKIVLEGQVQGGAKGLWQGLVVLRSDEPHRWSHVIIDGTTGVERGGWSLTAGVTIRSSEIRIENSVVRGNRTEDALNLIRSRFELHDVSIVDAASDAIDCDHAFGIIIGGTIREIQGDGIDVSGSHIRVADVLLEEIRDKAISVGEGSDLEARNVRIRNVGTAVAGKDGSEVIFDDSQVSDVRHVAIMAYTKKNEYGPARVRARNVRLDRVGREAVAQVGNIVVIDGVEVPSEVVDIEALYERGYMKK